MLQRIAVAYGGRPWNVSVLHLAEPHASSERIWGRESELQQAHSPSGPERGRTSRLPTLASHAR